ncbi:helix-turn-helix domain-containing protein, partial [Gemmatimonas sp.]|uniref:helix-turn-helix domain-containing protein n=1 Tax=Gemmatimonas sp. TaxID=1962908 RepID=UPI0039834422
MRAVARRIAEVRRLAGITQEALAEQLGIALKNVQRIESGRQNLTLQTLARVAT